MDGDTSIAIGISLERSYASFKYELYSIEAPFGHPPRKKTLDKPQELNTLLFVFQL